MAQIIAGLGAQLGLDTTEFKKGIGEAKKSLTELSEYLPEALSAAAFIEATKAAMEYANQVVETAKANDISTASVLELTKALNENGGSAEDASKLYSGFSVKIEAAAQGNAKAQESFARLGVTLKDLQTMSEQDLFDKTVKGLANMKDSAERNGLAFQTLGKAIRGVDLIGLANTLKESKGSMDKYANAIEQAHALSEKLNETTRTMKMEFADAFLPTMNALYDSFVKTGNAIEKMFGYLKKGTEIVGVFIAAIVTAVEHIITIVESTAKMFWHLTTGFDSLSDKWEQVKKDFSDGVADWKDDAASYAESVQKIIKANEDVTAPKKNQDINRPIIDALQKQKTKAEEISKVYEAQAQANYLTLTAQLAVTNATKNQKELEDALLKVVLEKNKVDEEIRKQEDEARASGKKNAQEIIDELEKQRVKVEQVYDDMIVKTKDAVIANQQLRESFGFGWNEAFNQYKENAMTAADFGRQAFTSMTSSMTNALNTFVTTGKLNFKSLITSMIQDMLKAQLQMQASNLFSKAGSALNIGNLFGGGGGGSGSVANLGTATGSDMMQAFADGGEPPVGQASLVGEAGPELFIPKSAGTIIPNNALGNLGGGGQSVTYNGPYIASMQAIDTQSATTFLAKNKTAVWAANQSAQRSLPQSR